MEFDLFFLSIRLKSCMGDGYCTLRSDRHCYSRAERRKDSTCTFRTDSMFHSLYATFLVFIAKYSSFPSYPYTFWYIAGCLTQPLNYQYTTHHPNPSCQTKLEDGCAVCANPHLGTRTEPIEPANKEPTIKL
jgi:hypothetical protein